MKSIRLSCEYHSALELFWFCFRYNWGALQIPPEDGSEPSLGDFPIVWVYRHSPFLPAIGKLDQMVIIDQDSLECHSGWLHIPQVLIQYAVDLIYPLSKNHPEERVLQLVYKQAPFVHLPRDHVLKLAFVSMKDRTVCITTPGFLLLALQSADALDTLTLPQINKWERIWWAAHRLLHYSHEDPAHQFSAHLIGYLPKAFLNPRTWDDNPLILDFLDESWMLQMDTTHNEPSSRFEWNPAVLSPTAMVPLRTWFEEWRNELILIQRPNPCRIGDSFLLHALVLSPVPYMIRKMIDSQISLLDHYQTPCNKGEPFTIPFLGDSNELIRTLSDFPANFPLPLNPEGLPPSTILIQKFIAFYESHYRCCIALIEHTDGLWLFQEKDSPNSRSIFVKEITDTGTFRCYPSGILGLARWVKNIEEDRLFSLMDNPLRIVQCDFREVKTVVQNWLAPNLPELLEVQKRIEALRRIGVRLDIQISSILSNDQVQLYFDQGNYWDGPLFAQDDNFSQREPQIQLLDSSYRFNEHDRLSLSPVNRLKINDNTFI